MKSNSSRRLMISTKTSFSTSKTNPTSKTSYSASKTCKNARPPKVKKRRLSKVKSWCSCNEVGSRAVTVLGRNSKSAPHMMTKHLTWTRKSMMSSIMVIKSRRRKMVESFPTSVKWQNNPTDIIASQTTLSTWWWSQIWTKSKPS